MCRSCQHLVEPLKMLESAANIRSYHDMCCTVQLARHMEATGAVQGAAASSSHRLTDWSSHLPVHSCHTHVGEGTGMRAS